VTGIEMKTQQRMKHDPPAANDNDDDDDDIGVMADMNYVTFSNNNMYPKKSTLRNTTMISTIT
jgi:hypothetical protein